MPFKDDITIQKEEIIVFSSKAAGIRVRVTQYEIKIIFLNYGLPQPEFNVSKEFIEALKTILEKVLIIQ